MPIDLPRQIPPLDWLRSFEAAARLSNFTAAANELGLTQAAVSQHIRSLEQRLKGQLFTRLPRGVELTPEGAAYLPHIQAAFATIGSSTAELFGPRTVESVVIRSPISFAVLMLAPMLPRLSDALPMVRLRIETIHKPADYGDAWNGLDIRFGHGTFAGRQADRLTRETLQPMASPKVGLDPAWQRLPLLSVVGAREMWSEWFAAAGMEPVAGRGHAFDTFVAALEAAASGAGVVLGSRPLADAAIEAGTLVPVSDFALDSGAGHCLTAPSGATLGRPAQAVRDWLVNAFADMAKTPPARFARP